MKSNGRPGTEGKRKAPRKLQMDSFEWTDDAILKFENQNSSASEESKAGSANKNTGKDVEKDGVPVTSDDPIPMEVTIARVQRRKMLEAERLSRLASLPKPPPQQATVLSEFVAPEEGEEVSAGEALSTALNSYFDKYLEKNADMVEASVATFPLYYFDDSVFDEGSKMTNADLLPLPYSACLIPPYEGFAPESSGDRSTKLGSWSSCIIHDVVLANVGKDNEGVMYDVELLGDLNYGERVTVPRLQVCFSSEHDTPSKYGERVVAAMQRRRDAVALLKYNYFVQNMPFNDAISSSLSEERGGSILERTYNSSRLFDIDPSVKDREMDEARQDFETCMNKIIFDANMLSSTNISSFQQLKLPAVAFPIPEPVKETGLVEGVPAHPMKARRTKFLADAFFASEPAIAALQAAVKLTTGPNEIKIIDMIYEKTYTLDKYERHISEQMLAAQRALKQEWPTRTGGVMRRTFEEALEILEANKPTVVLGEGFQKEEKASVIGPRYDPAIRLLSDYNEESTAIRGLLEKMNFIMGQTLFTSVKRNLMTFTGKSTLYAISLYLSSFYCWFLVSCFMWNVEWCIGQLALMFFYHSILYTSILYANNSITNSKPILPLSSLNTDSIEELCACEITIKDVRSVKVAFPPNSIYKVHVLPPMFSVSFRVTLEDKVLNPEEVDENLAAIKDWADSDEALGGEKCPIKKVKEVVGRSIEYDHSMPDFCSAVLKAFEDVVIEFSDVPHVRKYVMDRLYFPHPKFIPSVSMDIPWVKTCRTRITTAMEAAVAPLATYLAFFRKYEDFINIDKEAYVNDKLKVQRKDTESQEIELPVQVNLQAVISLIDDHLSQVADIEKNLPLEPINCGLFQVEVVSVRELLLTKHREIVEIILAKQAGYCQEINNSMDEEFKKVHEKLSVRPETVEEVAEVEEYLQGLGMVNMSLSGCIADMGKYYEVLDQYRYKIPYEQTCGKYTIIGAPGMVQMRVDEVILQNDAVKRKFHEDQVGEQSAFLKTLKQLDVNVQELSSYSDLRDVTAVAETVAALEDRLAQAAAKARLFNSREVLFESDVTDYEDLTRITKQFDPYLNLWQTAKDWTDKIKMWRGGPFVDLDGESIEADVDKFQIAVAKANKFFVKADMKEQAAIATDILKEVAAFKPEVPLIITLRNPGMRDRHWERIANEMGVDIMPIEDFTTQAVLDLNLKDRLEQVQKIGESAAKEYQIEQALDKMEKEWESMIIQIHPYRSTGTGVIKGVDDINAVLDEQITMAQTIMFSAFKGPFEERIDEWNRKLCCISDVLEAWVAVQRNWLYLQPIFESADINRQLPAEGKKFSTVDKGWRQAITAAKGLKGDGTRVIDFCDNDKLLERFRESEQLLDQVQKGLSDYLETKRGVFARFYFLSNDELLSILSESKDVKLVQPHLKKCFEGIDKVKFLPDLKIDRIISPEGEEVMLSELIDPVEKNVEHWMLELEDSMRVCIRDVMEAAIEDYAVTPRPRWMQKHPGMCVLNGSQMYWTTEMEDLFTNEGGKGPQMMFDNQLAQLADMTILVRGKLNNAARTTVGALTVIDVHARDVIKKLVDEEVENKHNFAWTSQLRYYWDGDLRTQMVAAKKDYGYEYLGNTFRLVITPLTDKCYLTLMGALQMIFGGAPAGPAGTGKTETTKDLAKALAMQCVVFNCSDGLDFVAMGKFFKGLAACGAWACFDEFNRINIEVLSVIGQQIMSIQTAVKTKQPRMQFEGSDIAVNDKFAVFITMNPGYAGRSALPDSLQALFRPVAMMVPDYALIGEIMFFAFGFTYGKECGAKMVTTFKLCSEQLSSQPHYDYGMRAVKTVITAAGNLKRAEPDADEMVLLLRALQDVNIPKFLEMDLPLFAGIISDLFPGKKRPELNYGPLMRNMKNEIRKKGLQPHSFFIAKVIQLYEMIVVRHGLMLVGPTGGGKSCNLHILQETLGALKDQGVEGFAYEHVQILKLNPKSITMGQMYGEVDSNTMEWKDGIMSTMYRNATVDTPERKWIMFDGPVDAIWIENMNTVLDDNKKLCLNSGEIIKMSGEMTMMFEVEDLTVASPATVSRVGIIFMEPRGLGLDVLVQSWLQRMPVCTPQLVKNKLNLLFDLYMSPGIMYLRANLKELAPTVDNNLAESLMRILDCYLAPYVWKEGQDPISDLMVADLVTCIEPLFLFALVWSVGATTNSQGRAYFDGWLRSEMYSNKCGWVFPKDGLVYDYLFLLDSKKWGKWMDIIEKHEVDVVKSSFSEIIVPTQDSVRNTYLLDLLLPNDKHVLMVGATGSGKTVNISQYLMGTSAKVQGRCIAPNIVPLTMTFSANTSANMTQDQLDSKMDKRKKGVFGPAAGKKFFIYVDDLNMPKRETYGAQPPIELLRQWFSQQGWYDRKELTFRTIVDLVFVASMGPPGGGKQDITPRFLRQFNMIGYVDMSKHSTSLIFSSILNPFLDLFDGGLVSMTQDIVDASIVVFDTIVAELLPTPSKSHYTFNLRDLAKIFQGCVTLYSCIFL